MEKNSLKINLDSRPRTSPQLTHRSLKTLSGTSRTLVRVTSAFGQSPLLSKRRSKRFSVTSDPHLKREDSQTKREQPIARWRRAARTTKTIVAICIALKRYASKTKTNTERSFFEMQLLLQDDLSKLVAFDPEVFRGSANNAHPLGDNIWAILTRPPDERGDEHIRKMMAILKWSATMQKYPNHVKAGICKCALYQRYGSGRILLRQGHPAHGFYVITSGEVIVNVKGEQPQSATGSISSMKHLGPGECFGETALLLDIPRTTTVVCKTDVELLVVMKEDFNRIIKEPMQKQRESNVHFLRTLPPFKELPEEFMKAVATEIKYQNYRKDVVIVENSSICENLVIIKSRRRVESWLLKNNALSEKYNQLESMKRQAFSSSPVIINTSDRRLQHDRFADVGKQKEKAKPSRRTGIGRTLLRVTAYTRKLQLPIIPPNPDNRRAFAQLTVLGTCCIFGLESVFQKNSLPLSLVSQGAECLLVPKMLFIKYCTPSVLQAVSDIVISYPSGEYILSQLEESKKWERYKRHLVEDVISRKKKISLR